MTNYFPGDQCVAHETLVVRYVGATLKDGNTPCAIVSTGYATHLVPFENLRPLNPSEGRRQLSE